MRVNNSDSQSNNIYKLFMQIDILKPMFQDIFLVNPSRKTVIEANETRIIETCDCCKDRCPLSKDKCGCICKETVSTQGSKCRFIYNDSGAKMILSKFISLKYNTLVMIMVMDVDSDFMFGTTPDTDAIDSISKVRSDIIRDPLTGIFNRKYLNDRANYFVENCVTNNKELNIACIDIDNFKQFNDKYGHAFGDIVLKTIAKLMQDIANEITDGDAYPIRIGGDEFVIIANNISKRTFKTLMNRLVISVENTKLDFENKKVGIRISVGVASMFMDKLFTYKEIYDKADEQLYKAKEAGKGCVR